MENQLRLDLINEEETIDEIQLNGTQNFWIKDVQKNEENYELQEIYSLEQEKLELLGQCAKLEHDITFMKLLFRVSKQFNQTGKPTKSSVYNASNPMVISQQQHQSLQS